MKSIQTGEFCFQSFSLYLTDFFCSKFVVTIFSELLAACLILLLHTLSIVYNTVLMLIIDLFSSVYCSLSHDYLICDFCNLMKLAMASPLNLTWLCSMTPQLNLLHLFITYVVYLLTIDFALKKEQGNLNSTIHWPSCESQNISDLTELK